MFLNCYEYFMYHKINFLSYSELCLKTTFLIALLSIISLTFSISNSNSKIPKLMNDGVDIYLVFNIFTIIQNLDKSKFSPIL